MVRSIAARTSPAALVLALACASLGAATGPVAGLSFAETTFGVDAGLPSDVAQALVQTRDGYLWFGTEEGLARFDGVRFRIYRVKDVPELGSDLVRCLRESRDGSLWIGTQAGLAVYRDGEFRRIGGISTPVGAITEDPSGTVWIGTWYAGLWMYRDGRLVRKADTRLVKATDSPIRVLADDGGRIWAALDRGPLVWIEHGVTRPAVGPLSSVRGVNCITEGPDRTFWLGTSQGLFRYRDGVLAQFGRTAGIGEEPITDIYVDRSRQLWVAAHNLWVAADPERDDFKRVLLPQIEYPRYLIQDREGDYWIGCSGDGVARLRPSPFRMARYADGSPLRRARSVTIDADGNVWAALGMDARGLARIARDGTVSFVPVGTGANSDVSTVCATAAGDVWIGTPGALARWHAGVVRHYPALQNVRAVFQSRDGTVWFGLAYGGVFTFRNGVFSRLELTGDFGNRTPSVFAEGPDGAVYAGFMSDGILRIDGRGKIPARRIDDLPSQDVRAIHFDEAGRMWVGFRRHGLAVRIDGRWLNPPGLVTPFANCVSAIRQDRTGHLWLGTLRGIMWAKMADILDVARGARVEGRFRVAGGAEGVGGGVIGMGMQPNTWRGRDGSLWFAGRAGLVQVRPVAIPRNTIPPPVRIEWVSVDGRRLEPGKALSLAPGVRSLSIDYTGLSFVQPSRVQFRYRLVGYDRDWVRAGTRRTAFYTHLAPGRYVFRVIARNEDGVWNRVGARLEVVQRPWFYESWWFYVLGAFGLGSCAAGLYAWRTAGLRRIVAEQTKRIREQSEHERKLQAELERTARLESLGVLAGGIAHDFNNLLTVVMANIGLASADERVRSAAGDLLAAAELGARRAAELTQQLLTFAKGGDPVRRAVLLPDVVREAADFARHASSVRCDLEIEPGLPPADVDRGQISRVVHNLVLNAAQAMPDGGVVRLKLAGSTVRLGDEPGLAAGQYVVLSVSDEGPGIAPENLARLFEPYFSTKAGNSGLGLATVHSIVKKHLGHIKVESSRGVGTTFRIWLPVAMESVEPGRPERETAPQRGTRSRVLFMDDEEIIRTAARNILARLGYEATLVADGAAVVREYDSALRGGRPYDVVILDLTVPGGMGGRATIEALRRIDPDVRAIVSSGYSSDPILANYREFGFKAVVPKPYRINELVHAIEEVLGIAGGLRPRSSAAAKR